jgi:ubiquinone biosynthesis protein
MPIPKIAVISRRSHQINRYREIIAILVKYGFGDVLAKLELQKHLEFGESFIWGKAAANIAALSRWERVRMALEELGPTFVKFGQIMSTRPDMIPQELISELERLQDTVPPFSAEDGKRIIEEELGESVDSIFKDFIDTPIAAASIAQVYKAVLADGEEVAIKVQRPEIDRIIEVDLEIMLRVATLIEKHLKELGTLHPVEIVEEFARVIEKEQDFRIELAHIERFARNFQADPTIYVPSVHRELSTSKVLTMEFIGGVKVSDITKAELQVRYSGKDPKVVASRGATLILKQIFEHGFFHADPHPGNIRILKDNVICFLDYGMMGSLSARHREDLADVLIGIINYDESKVTKAVLKLTEPGYRQIVDRGTLELDISEFIGVYAYGTLEELEIGQLLNSIMNIVAGHHLKVPRDFYLLAKALVTIESVGRKLDPEFNAVKHAKPFAESAILKRMGPRRLVEDFSTSAIEASSLMRDLPAEARDILALIKEGEAKIRFKHEGLDPMLKTLDQAVNRAVFAIVLASLVIGSALIVHSGVPPRWHEISVIGIIGFLGAGMIGFWLLFSILRHQKM